MYITYNYITVSILKRHMNSKYLIQNIEYDSYYFSDRGDKHVFSVLIMIFFYYYFLCPSRVGPEKIIQYLTWKVVSSR